MLISLSWCRSEDLFVLEVYVGGFWLVTCHSIGTILLYESARYPRSSEDGYDFELSQMVPCFSIYSFGQ